MEPKEDAIWTTQIKTFPLGIYRTAKGKSEDKDHYWFQNMKCIDKEERRRKNWQWFRTSEHCVNLEYVNVSLAHRRTSVARTFPRAKKQMPKR